MEPQPKALGYLHVDGGTYPSATLAEANLRLRKTAIELRALEEGLALKDVSVDDVRGSRRMFSRLTGAATFALISGGKSEVVMMFEYTDLGVTCANQASARERISDLGMRLEVIQ